MVASLTRAFGPSSLGLAEESVGDAFAAALATWPYRGLPDDPEAWLFRAARNKALDRLRRATRWDGGGSEIVERAADAIAADSPPDLDAIADDQLRLLFVCGHPALPREARAALALKLVCGFGTGEIGRLMLSTEAAVERRLSRAKARIKDLGLRFEVPEGPERAERVGAVLTALYLMFTAGHATGGGETALRRDLCAEALRLARLVAAGTQDGDAEALAALFAFQAARIPARSETEAILLADQDRAAWDRGLIAEGFARLRRAMRSPRLTAWHVEAGIASIHAHAASDSETDWPAIRAQYDLLVEIAPGPAQRLNRAVAILMTEGPAAAREALAPLAGEPALSRYPLFFATIAEVERRCGRAEQALAAIEAALALPLNAADRRLLEARKAACEAMPR